MSDIFKQVGDVLAGLDTRADHLDPSPLELTLRLFLCACYGPHWTGCEITAFSTPAGLAYVAVRKPHEMEPSNLLVPEHEQGVQMFIPVPGNQYRICPPVELANIRPAVEQEQEEEPQGLEAGPLTMHCIENINEAVCDIARFIKRSRMTKVHKQWRSEEHTSELQSPDHLVCR